MLHGDCPEQSKAVDSKNKRLARKLDFVIIVQIVISFRKWCSDFTGRDTDKNGKCFARQDMVVRK